jgi:hypothetical protein
MIFNKRVKYKDNLALSITVSGSEDEIFMREREARYSLHGRWKVAIL